jgi:hypothetical protein
MDLDVLNPHSRRFAEGGTFDADLTRESPWDAGSRAERMRGCVRDARPQGRDTGARARVPRKRAVAWRSGGSTPLATVVSLPTARAARPGAQRRDTPKPCGSRKFCTTQEQGT